MKKNQKYLYRMVELSYLLEYFMFSKNIQKDIVTLEKRITEPDFIGILILTVDNISEKNNYPKECIQKLKLLVEFLMTRGKQDLLEESYQKLKEIKEYSYQIYQSNFCMKINRIQNGIGHSFIAWSKEAIEKSIRDDYFHLQSMINPSQEQNGISKQVLNQNYLYTLKKILFSSPKLFLDPVIRNNVLKILIINHMFLSTQIIDLDGVISPNVFLLDYFNERNYGFQNNKELVSQLLEIFRLENKDLIKKISDSKKITHIQPFYFDEFSTYKDQIMIETIICSSFDDLIDKLDRKEDTVLLQNIYNLIDYNQEHKIYDEQAKRRLIDILNTFKEHYQGSDRKLFLRKYNEQLGKLNETVGSKITLVETLSRLKLSYRDHLKMRGDFKLQQDLVDSIQMDYLILSSFCLDDEKYIERKKILLSDVDYISSIHRFLTEESMLFEEPTILEKTIELLEEYLELSKQDSIIDRRLKKSIQKSLNRLKKYH